MSHIHLKLLLFVSIALLFNDISLTYSSCCQFLFYTQFKSKIPPASERKKLIPLALMFFFILFNYTILRDTKDVLMVTAKGSSAEVIPFIKTYVNLSVSYYIYIL